MSSPTTGPPFLHRTTRGGRGGDLNGYFALAIGSQVRFLRPRDAGAFEVTDFDDGPPGTAVAVDGDGAYLVDSDGVRSFRLSAMESSFVPDGGSWFAGAAQGFGPFVVHDEVLGLVGSTSGGETRTAPSFAREIQLPPPGRNGCPEARITELLPHCDSPCDVGDALTDLRPGDQAVEVECTGALGQTTWSMRYDGDCSAQPLTGRSSRVPRGAHAGEQRGAMGDGAAAGRRGGARRHAGRRAAA